MSLAASGRVRTIRKPANGQFGGLTDAIPSAPLIRRSWGRFDNGVGTFYSDGTLEGKAIRTQFVWSHITPTSARWEQAYSSDGGKTWETNWVMEFRRAS